VSSDTSSSSTADAAAAAASVVATAPADAAAPSASSRVTFSVPDPAPASEITSSSTAHLSPAPASQSSSDSEAFEFDEDDMEDTAPARDARVASEELEFDDTNDTSERTLRALARRDCTQPPLAARRGIVEKAHLLGHFGRRAIAEKIMRSGSYWPTLHSDIREVIASCPDCARVEVFRRGYHPARTIDAPLPGDHYQIDLAQLPVSEDGYKFIFVLIDVFSGFVMLRALKDKSAVTIARTLWEICAIIGLPRVLQSDNGAEFVNRIVRAMLSLHGVQHRTIAPYNPRSDGKVERTVGTVKKTLLKLLQGADVYWPLHLPFVQYSYNDKVQDITGATAFSVMFGRLPNNPVAYDSDSFVDLPQATAEWKEHQHSLVSLIYPAIRLRRDEHQDQYRQRMDDARRHLFKSSLPVGTKVMIRDPLYTINPSMRPSAETPFVGPYTIARRSTHGPYYLIDDTGAPHARPVPVDQMKVVHSDAKHPARQAELDDARSSSSSSSSSSSTQSSDSVSSLPSTDSNAHVIKTILNHRFRNGALEYRVQWKEDSSSTWEPASNINDTASVTRYFREKEAKKRDRHLGK
jgi:transposase InsO family protein